MIIIQRRHVLTRLSHIEVHKLVSDKYICHNLSNLSADGDKQTPYG